MIDFDTLVTGPAVAVFGQAVTYAPFTASRNPYGELVLDANGDPTGTFGTSYAATGVFDAQYIEVTPLGRGPFVSTEGMEFGATGGITEAQPVLGVQLSAMLTVPGQGDQVTVGATVYVVKEVQPDSHGWALLLLNLAP